MTVGARWRALPRGLVGRVRIDTAFRAELGRAGLALFVVRHLQRDQFQKQLNEPASAR